MVGFVGRIEPRKGVLDLLAAARMLTAACAEPARRDRARAGRSRPTASTSGASLEMAASLGETVLVTGPVEDARRLMPWFDVLCVPSLVEPFGTVAAEALAAGTPAVVTDSGGMPEYVTSGRSGEVVPPGDARTPRRRAGARAGSSARRWRTPRARTRRASPQRRRRERRRRFCARVRGAMKVALDLRVLDDAATAERGIGRYASELAAALAEVGIEVADLRRVPRRKAGADVLHSPSIDRASIRPGLPYVVTVHDLAPIKYRDRYLRTGLKHRLRYAAVKRASRVIVPSQAVADDAKSLLGLSGVDVVAEAPAAAFRPVPAPRGLLTRLRLPDRFLLWVGGLDPPDPRKGLAPLIRRAETGACPPLVLAGRHDAASGRLAVTGRVVLTGRVDDEELAALYSAADALVLPSEDEGFGLTPHEALACGTPVAAYAIPALSETLGDNPGVRLVPPGDLDALLAAAEELAGMDAQPSGRTWADVARETAAVYERAVDQR